MAVKRCTRCGKLRRIYKSSYCKSCWFWLLKPR